MISPFYRIDIQVFLKAQFISGEVTLLNVAGFQLANVLRWCQKSTYF